MNLKIAAIYKESVRALLDIYEDREAESIINILFEDLMTISRIHRLTNPEQELTIEQFKLWEKAIDQLKNAVPIQHIIGFTEFFGRKFLVNKNTLIPRPETEELVALISNDHRGLSNLSVLDIGAGSGCIAISLALELDHSIIESWDISKDALIIAEQNNANLKARVIFGHVDALGEWPTKKWDIIVSNPPYIPESEWSSMHQNVTKHEPKTALFVPDHDPLLFYKHISDRASTHLKKDGKLYFEIHEKFGEETKLMLDAKGFRDIQIIQDLNGKNRMMKATRPL